MLPFFFSQFFKCGLIFTLFFVLTNLTQITLALVESKQPLDINNKAEELGITTTELNSMLNSALRNGGGGDPLPEAIRKKFFTGRHRLGTSVSTAGDVNGDGYSDVIVCASPIKAEGSSPGKAYIYFGGTSMDNIADVTMTGEEANDFFGESVSTAGDVNGDGYSDVIIGAWQNGAGGSGAAGHIFILVVHQWIT